MTIGQEEKVFILTVGVEIFRIVLHHMMVNSHEVLHTTEASTWMSTLHGMYHPNNIPSGLATNSLKVFNFSHLAALSGKIIESQAAGLADVNKL